jgi:hypothetical protein
MAKGHTIRAEGMGAFLPEEAPSLPHIFRCVFYRLCKQQLGEPQPLYGKSHSVQSRLGPALSSSQGAQCSPELRLVLQLCHQGRRDIQLLLRL